MKTSGIKKVAELLKDNDCQVKASDLIEEAKILASLSPKMQRLICEELELRLFGKVLEP